MLKLIALPIFAAAIMIAPVAHAEDADTVDLSDNYWAPQGIGGPTATVFGPAAPRVTGAIRTDRAMAAPVSHLDVDPLAGMNQRFSNTGINF